MERRFEGRKEAFLEKQVEDTRIEVFLLLVKRLSSLKSSLTSEDTKYYLSKIERLLVDDSQDLFDRIKLIQLISLFHDHASLPGTCIKFLQNCCQ